MTALDNSVRMCTCGRSSSSLEKSPPPAAITAVREGALAICCLLLDGSPGLVVVFAAVGAGLECLPAGGAAEAVFGAGTEETPTIERCKHPSASNVSHRTAQSNVYRPPHPPDISAASALVARSCRRSLVSLARDTMPSKAARPIASPV